MIKENKDVLVLEKYQKDLERSYNGIIAIEDLMDTMLIANNINDRNIKLATIVLENISNNNGIPTKNIINKLNLDHSQLAIEAITKEDIKKLWEKFKAFLRKIWEFFLSLVDKFINTSNKLITKLEEIDKELKSLTIIEKEISNIYIQKAFSNIGMITNFDPNNAFNLIKDNFFFTNDLNKVIKDISEKLTTKLEHLLTELNKDKFIESNDVFTEINSIVNNDLKSIIRNNKHDLNIITFGPFVNGTIFEYNKKDKEWNASELVKDVKLKPIPTLNTKQIEDLSDITKALLYANSKNFNNTTLSNIEKRLDNIVIKTEIKFIRDLYSHKITHDNLEEYNRMKEDGKQIQKSAMFVSRFIFGCVKNIYKINLLGARRAIEYIEASM